MMPTPHEQAAIDAAAAASPALRRLEKEKLADAKKDKRWGGLTQVVSAGADAAVALAGRRINRRKYSVSSGNTGKIRGMLEQALPHRTATIDELDADKLAFNVRNGTIRFVVEEYPDPDASDYSERRIRRYRAELHRQSGGRCLHDAQPLSARRQSSLAQGLLGGEGAAHCQSGCGPDRR